MQKLKTLNDTEEKVLFKLKSVRAKGDTRSINLKVKILDNNNYNKRWQMLKLQLLKKTDFQKAPKVRWKKTGF